MEPFKGKNGYAPLDEAQRLQLAGAGKSYMANQRTPLKPAAPIKREPEVRSAVKTGVAPTSTGGPLKLSPETINTIWSQKKASDAYHAANPQKPAASAPQSSAPAKPIMATGVMGSSVAPVGAASAGTPARAVLPRVASRPMPQPMSRPGMAQPAKLGTATDRLKGQLAALRQRS